MKYGLIIGVVVILAVISFAIFFITNSASVANTNSGSSSGSSSSGGTVPTGSIGGTQVFDVAVTDSGFSPETITVPAGSLVRFTNQRSVAVWVASDVHPTHRAYPGSDIAKCGTDAQIFDACGEFNQGDVYSFVFNEKGTWRYHDHLHSSIKGTIIVESIVN